MVAEAAYCQWLIALLTDCFEEAGREPVDLLHDSQPPLMGAKWAMEPHLVWRPHVGNEHPPGLRHVCREIVRRPEVKFGHAFEGDSRPGRQSLDRRLHASLVRQRAGQQAGLGHLRQRRHQREVQVAASGL